MMFNGFPNINFLSVALEYISAQAVVHCLSICLAMGARDPSAHLHRVSVCCHGPGVPAGAFERGPGVPAGARDCKHSKQHGRCHFAHELQSVMMPASDPGGRSYELSIFQTSFSMYFGQEYTWKHRAAIEAWAHGVSDEFLPLWYHMLRWYETGFENSESSLELHGADFGHGQRQQEFHARTMQYPPVWNQVLDEQLRIRLLAYPVAEAALGDWVGGKREAVSGGGDEESEPEAGGSAKRRRAAAWYMEYEHPEYREEWACRLGAAQWKNELPCLTIDHRILGRLEATNKGEYGHVTQFLQYKELLQMTKHCSPQAWWVQEYEFLRALFVAPMKQEAGSLRSEYCSPVEYGRHLEEANENVFAVVMGQLTPELGVTRYIVARRRPCTESIYAHGTGGLGFLGIWRDLQVWGTEAHHGNVYAYPSLDSVHEKEYAFFEHFGGGLWARFSVLLEGPIKKSGSSVPQQWIAQGALVPEAFVIDVAPTYAVLQMALRQPIALGEFSV